jgi:hypothetical protein
MKMHSVVAGCVCFLLIQTAFTGKFHAQNAKSDKAVEKASAVKRMVAAQHYVFKAQMVMPMGGRSRPLTSDYDVSVSKDSIVAWLPYFGRAYTAPIDPTRGGIQFNSKKFNYTLLDRKRGGWDITIRPSDVTDIQQLTLSVTESGYASLQVISNSRQPISFTGYIREREQSKKD